MKDDGPSCNETVSYSAFLKRVLEWCALFRRLAGAGTLLKWGNRRKTHPQNAQCFLGNQAAQTLVEQMVQQTQTGVREVGIADIDPISKFRWLFPADMVHKPKATNPQGEGAYQWTERHSG